MKNAIALLSMLVLASGCRQSIQHGLDEGQANEIEARLSEAGLQPRKERESGRHPTWAISVPKGESGRAVKALTDLGLPRTTAPGFAELFGKGSIVPSPAEENALFVHALAGELSRTLVSVDGVVGARVHIVSRGAPTAFARTPPEPRAAVLLKARSRSVALLNARIDEFRALVAGAVEGLSPEHVAILITEVPEATPAPAPTARTPALPAVLGTLALALGVGLCGVIVAQQYRRKAPGEPSRDELRPQPPAARSAHPA